MQCLLIQENASLRDLERCRAVEDKRSDLRLDKRTDPRFPSQRWTVCPRCWPPEVYVIGAVAGLGADTHRSMPL